jgi:protein arginine N-methyltransferase 1
VRFVGREYGLLEHGTMVGDPVRVSTYLDAIQRAVKPGAVVVDVGCGTGLFTLAACAAGARRVFAIEPSPIRRVAQAVVAANGFASRVDFLEVPSTRATLPERADVIVMDLRGVLPDGQPGAAIDARNRFLAPRGVIIPTVETLWAAPVEAPDAYARHVAVAGDDDGIDVGAARAWALRQSSRWRVQPEQLLAAPRLCTTIVYAAVDRTDIRADLHWAASRSGVAHGIAVWFDSELYDGVTQSNRPGAPDCLYAQRFFPVPRPVPVVAGQALDAHLRGDSRDDDYEWQCGLDG